MRVSFVFTITSLLFLMSTSACTWVQPEEIHFFGTSATTEDGLFVVGVYQGTSKLYDLPISYEEGPLALDASYTMKTTTLPTGTSSFSQATVYANDSQYFLNLTEVDTNSWDPISVYTDTVNLTAIASELAYLQHNKTLVEYWNTTQVHDSIVIETDKLAFVIFQDRLVIIDLDLNVVSSTKLIDFNTGYYIGFGALNIVASHHAFYYQSNGADCLKYKVWGYNASSIWTIGTAHTYPSQAGMVDFASEYFVTTSYDEDNLYFTFKSFDLSKARTYTMDRLSFGSDNVSSIIDSTPEDSSNIENTTPTSLPVNMFITSIGIISIYVLRSLIRKA